MDQLEFDLWDRRTKFEVLNAARFTLADGGPPVTSFRNVYSLLEQIELCSGNGVCNARGDVLATRMRVSRGTFNRALSIAERLQVVSVERHPQATGGQGASKYFIDWLRLRDFARPSAPAYQLHRASGQARVKINGEDIYLGPHNSPDGAFQVSSSLTLHALSGTLPAVTSIESGSTRHVPWHAVRQPARYPRGTAAVTPQEA